MIFTSSLVMIYVGLVRPFHDKFANILELVNEVLILLASYSLITFSALVPDAKIRSHSGYFLIIMAFATMIMNVFIIVISKIWTLYTLCLNLPKAIIY